MRGEHFPTVITGEKFVRLPNFCLGSGREVVLDIATRGPRISRVGGVDIASRWTRCDLNLSWSSWRNRTPDGLLPWLSFEWLSYGWGIPRLEIATRWSYIRFKYRYTVSDLGPSTKRLSRVSTGVCRLGEVLCLFARQVYPRLTWNWRHHATPWPFCTKPVATRGHGMPGISILLQITTTRGIHCLLAWTTRGRHIRLQFYLRSGLKRNKTERYRFVSMNS